MLPRMQFSWRLLSFVVASSASLGDDDCGALVQTQHASAIQVNQGHSDDSTPANKFRSSRDLATSFINGEMLLPSTPDLPIRFLSAVPTFGPGTNYIALLHSWSMPVWVALEQHGGLFCSGAGKPNRTKLRMLEGPNVFTVLCDWPSSEAHKGYYQVYLQTEDGTSVGHIDAAYTPNMLHQYGTAACVSSVWDNKTLGVYALQMVPQWMEYHLKHGFIDHFIVYTMNGTDSLLLDFYRPYLDAGVATRVHFFLPAGYETAGYSTQIWVANDCLYRTKNHAKWLFPSLDVDEYMRMPNMEKQQPWDNLVDTWRAKNQDKRQVHSISFSGYAFLRTTGNPFTVTIADEFRWQWRQPVPPKFVVDTSITNLVFIHWPTNWANATVGLMVPPKYAVKNHYCIKTPDEMEAVQTNGVRDTALRADILALQLAVESRFNMTWENLLSIKANRVKPDSGTMWMNKLNNMTEVSLLSIKANRVKPDSGTMWMNKLNNITEVQVLEPPPPGK